MARKRTWHKADIKAELEKRIGKSLAQLDAEHGLPVGTCSAALRRPHPQGEAVIAALLGVAPVMLWPSRYHRDGTRKRPQPMENYRSGAAGGHRQKEARA
ncbi:MAG TPA: helix-turn-helix domain-containing protein [Azospirillum sp.]|nr:helix-turn-helix domain-containing protein [Azospirillum sp.]